MRVDMERNIRVKVCRSRNLYCAQSLLESEQGEEAEWQYMYFCIVYRSAD